MRVALTAPLLSLAVGLLARPAGADPVDPQRLAAAQVLFDQGQDAMEKKDYATACPKLEEVTRLLPEGVGGQITLAQCYEGAGRLASAWTTYRVAQALAAQAKKADDEAQARERAEALKPRLAQITITVPEQTRALPGLTIVREGITVGPAQWGTPLPVDKGKHVVVATATGKQRWEQVVEVPADGIVGTVEVTGLLDLPAPARAPTWNGLRTGGVVLGVAGLLGVAAGAAFGGIALSKKSQSGGECGAGAGSADPNHCTAAGAQLRSDAILAGNVSTGTFVAGGALLVAGVTLFAIGSRAPAKVEAKVGVGSLRISGAW
jgi:hypothetical protein